VPCVDCQKEPGSLRQYCECCGRELASAAASAKPSPTADARPDAASHCHICGAPSPAGGFCGDCFGSFSAWASAEPAAPAAEPVPGPAAELVPAPPAAKTDPVDDNLWSQLMNTPAPPDLIDLDPSPKQVLLPPAVSQTPAVADHKGANIAVSTPAQDNGQTMPPPPLSQPAGPAVIQREPVPVETIRIEPPRSPSLAPIPEAANVHVPARSASKAPAVSNRPHAPARSRSHGVWMLPAAVVVVTAGLGGYWLKVHGWLSHEPQQETTMAVNEPGREPRPAPRPAEPVRPAAPERSAQPAPPTKTRIATKPAATRQSPAAAARTRAATAPAPDPIPAVSVSLPAVTTPHPEASRSAGLPSPAAPQGPFFEPTDVNETPRVVTRVEPDVPDDLRSRARNEIVIIRMLVSQSGRPSRVSLLRRSKTGPRLDEAVIAAVNQWTFSPAKRRGEAVSCWFNMGVPVMAN
jgi:periplasmic protein TonB